jgi:carbon monoxide dehydrogenase subunit G
MTTRWLPTGGRFGARRLLVSSALVLLIATPMTGLDAADPDPSAPPRVTVNEAGGVYSVAARFHVPQPPAVVLAVLTDYENIPRFTSGVTSSIVLERGIGRAVVEQDATSRLMMFSKRVHLVLEIAEGTDTLSFRDRSGRSFARYEGAWRLCDRDGGTEILYELTAQPSFDVPEFVLKRLLKRDSAQMIDGLRREMAARAARGTH